MRRIERVGRHQAERETRARWTRRRKWPRRPGKRRRRRSKDAIEKGKEALAKGKEELLKSAGRAGREDRAGKSINGLTGDAKTEATKLYDDIKKMLGDFTASDKLEGWKEKLEPMIKKLKDMLKL